MAYRLKNMLKSPFSMLPIVVVLIVFTSGISAYFTVLENEKNLEIAEKIEEQQKEREWKAIEGAIRHGMDLYRQNSKLIGVRLENDLRNSYPDLDVLEHQMDTDTFDQTFFDIVKGHLQENQPNQTRTRPYVKTIGTEKHVIAFYTNIRNNTLSLVEKDRDPLDMTSVQWNEVPDYNLNPTLSEKAIQAITVDRDRDVIYTQVSKSSSGLVEEITDMSMSELRHIFNEVGIEEFRHIDLLAPAYITEDGDIFGNQDSVKGFNKNRTKKLVLTQSVNLYDLLEHQRDVFLETQANLEKSMLFIQQYGQQKTFVSILLSFVLWSVAIFLVIVYNSEIKNRKLRGGGR